MTRGLRCETFSKNTFGISFLLQTNGGRAFSLEEGGSALPPPLQPLQACLSRVMAARPNQTKQNGRNQRRESHPLAIKSMPLSLSLWQLVQTKPNKMAEIRLGFPFPLPLQNCLSLVMAASPNQTKQNKMAEIRRGFLIRPPLQECLLWQLVQTKPCKLMEIRQGNLILLP